MPQVSPRRAPQFNRLVLVFLSLVFATLSSGAAAQEGNVGNSSGLPIPRFVSVSAAPVNVRVGPGTNYDIAWTFVKPNVPVEIFEEFDTWRHVRDNEGEDGWIHQSLLSGARTGLVAPSGERSALRGDPRNDAQVRAWLTPDLLVNIESCDGRYCDVRLAHEDARGRSRNFEGYIAQGDLFGVLEGEVFD